MIRIEKYIIAIIITCFITANVSANISTNIYQVKQLQSIHTELDTIYDHFQSYIGTIENDSFIIEKPYNATSYRLNKKIITVVNYVNNSDTTLHLKFYSTLNKYINVGETDTVLSNKIVLKKSDYIKSNKQFFEITILPKSTLHAFLIYQPISFKDYFVNKNSIYCYSNIYSFPAYNTNTNKRNFGFTLQYLFILGMVLIMFIFYLLAYFYIKDKIYLYYTFYLLTTFCQILYMAQYIFTKNIKMFNIIGNSAVDESTKGLMIFFYSIFYQQAFRITKNEKVLFYATMALKYISLVYVGVIVLGHLFLISFYNEPFIYSLYRIPIFFFSIVSLIATYKIANKNLFQRIIFLGSIIYTVFTAISTLQKINFPIKDFYVDVNILYVGVALELIIFSVALIIRIKDSFLATEKLKDQLIFELQQNEEFIKNENSFLEEKVKERVAEIEQQNLLIEDQKRLALIQSFEKEKVEIQMQALSSQMNPHFIFNCMNSIQHSIVTNDNEKASSMLHSFASLIRMVLENSSEPDISLDNEILLLTTYLKLEQERNNQLFDFDIKVEPGLSTDFLKIPIMMIQPFLENVIWHAFKFINYKGYVLVYFSFINNMVRCEITDNGIGRKKAEEYNLRYRTKNNKSIAINIIQDRINILNPNADLQKASLQVIDLYNEQEQATGTKIIIHLPVL
ncbi:MAG TPA: histidine kinase [Chitinophagales bacterium]|nr:histidine kinase [Chitinophagales bacterium]